MHLYLMAYEIAKFRSPSYSKTKGSFPPNSITAFLRYFPDASAMTAPDLEDPVKLTPDTLGDWRIRSS